MTNEEVIEQLKSWAVYSSRPGIVVKVECNVSVDDYAGVQKCFEDAFLNDQNDPNDQLFSVSVNSKLISNFLTTQEARDLLHVIMAVLDSIR